MSASTLILGLAAGYHYGDVRPFLVSLERAGYQGECVLFVSKTTRDLDRINAHPVTTIPFERPSGLDHIPYNALRYFLYLDYLQKEHHHFDRILMTDVRDVVFQRDPFDFPWQEGLNCTLEDRRITIGQCPHNSHWIRSHLGKEALAQIAHQPISCSGTTTGNHEAVIDYLHAMTPLLATFEPGERMAGYDQGVHNHLIHTNQLANVTVHDNTGPILTLGYVRGEPAMDPNGFVLNETGSPAHMVHQYDRKPTLFKALRKQLT